MQADAGPDAPWLFSLKPPQQSPPFVCSGSPQPQTRLTGPAGAAVTCGARRKAAMSGRPAAAPLGSVPSPPSLARAGSLSSWVVSLLLQTTRASPRSRAIPREAAVRCPRSLPAPPLASQMVLYQGHEGRRGNALILLLGCFLTSWWSCLRVRKAAKTRNLVRCSYQSKIPGMLSSKLAQAETCEAGYQPSEAEKW